MLGATAIGEVADGTGDLEVGFPSDADARAAAGELQTWRRDLAIEVVDAGPALAAALDAWKPHAQAVRVGQLVVRPSWIPSTGHGSAGAGVREVVVDPTLAFGFDHPTTLSCLAALEEVVGEGSAVLDVGCGSGVLSLAAAALGAAPVVAVDVDPVAVAATAQAAATAGFDIDARTGGVAAAGGQYDVVVANIGARTLIDLAPQLVDRLRGHASRLVLSGLLVAQTAAVVDVYRAAGLGLVATGERSGWATPVFAGKSTFSAG